MGKILALDFGKKRVGYALSDESETIAFPRGAFSKNEAVREVRGIIQREKIAKLVIGLPLGEENEENDATQQIRKFGDKIHHATGIPVFYVDEFLSTKEAQSKIPSRKARRQKGEDDAVSAQIILKRFLDVHA